MEPVVYMTFVDVSNTGWPVPFTVPKMEMRGLVPIALVKGVMGVTWMSLHPQNPLKNR
jgi:hypothetical protein